MKTNSILDEINQLFSEIIAGVLHMVPQLILALIILFIGWSIAKITQISIRKFILYLDRNFNENLKKKFMQVDLHDSAKFISKGFFWIIFCIALALASQILGFTILNTWLNGLVLYLPNILAAIVIVFFGIIAGRLASDLIYSATSRATIPSGKFLSQLIRYSIIFITIIIAIDQIGIDIAFLTTLVSIIVTMLLFGAALAFALGAKVSVSNILGAYYIQKIYKEGDIIQIDELEGVIIKITPSVVILETKSGQFTIPAKDFNEKKTALINKV